MIGDKSFALICIILLLAASLLGFAVIPAKAEGIIFIKADGSIDPSTVPLHTQDRITYMLASDVNGSIYVQRNNVIVDGSSYTVQSNESEAGIRIYSLSNVTIKNLNIRGFTYGIDLSSTTNCSIIGNNITSATQFGIKFRVSSSNIVTNNNISGNVQSGIWLSASPGNVISDNLLTNSQFGINLYPDQSAHNVIARNTIANNQYGLKLANGPNNNRIEGNNIANNTYGLSLSASSENLVWGNSIQNNTYGIELLTSPANTFYHNNFIDNTIHVLKSSVLSIWDCSYPLGGNFWSNYSSIDLYSGVHQNESGSDGIGDAYHVIDEINVDRYPLTDITNVFSASSWNGKPYIVDIVSNATVSGFQLKVSQRAISFNITSEGGNPSFSRITIPNVVSQGLWPYGFLIRLDGEDWPFEKWTGASNTVLIINYTDLGHKVEVVSAASSPPVDFLLIGLVAGIALGILSIVILSLKRKRSETPSRKS